MTKARREFTPEFKREAVALLESSGRPLMQIAAELGATRVIALKVAGAFHSDLMKPADSRLARVLADGPPLDAGMNGVVSVLRRGLALRRCRLWLRSGDGARAQPRHLIPKDQAPSDPQPSTDYRAGQSTTTTGYQLLVHASLHACSFMRLNVSG